MSVFTIATKFGDPQSFLRKITAAQIDPVEAGIMAQNFFYCPTQPNIFWAVTEWQTLKHHNVLAQALLKGQRKDDRLEAITCGPNPSFEIFCKAAEAFRTGELSTDMQYIIVAHGLISTQTRAKYLALRQERYTKIAPRLPYLRIYHNAFNADEFVAVLGFANKAEFEAARVVDELLLEEYLFTGLEQPMGMGLLANYNQFICTLTL